MKDNTKLKVALVVLLIVMVMNAITMIKNKDAMQSQKKTNPVSNSLAENKTEEDFVNEALELIIGNTVLTNTVSNEVPKEITEPEDDEELKSVDHGIGAVIDDELKQIRINNGEYYYIYEHNDEKITKVTAYIEYYSNEDANTALNGIEGTNLDEGVKEIRVDGNKLVIDFESSVWELLTLKEMQMKAQALMLLYPNAE